MRSVALMTLIAIAALLPSRGKAADCPADTMHVQGRTFVSTAPSGAAGDSWVCDYGGYYGRGEGRAAYDLVKGTEDVFASAYGECDAIASVSTHDHFTLIGPDSPVPVGFAAQLSVSSTIDDANGYDWASIREGDSNQQSTTEGGVPPLVLSIVRGPGETFDISVDLGGYSEYSGGGFVHSQLSFPNLPSGYAVVSCQGFVSDPVVPVRAMSWGRLKSLYR